MLDKKPLGTLLLEAKLITEENLSRALNIQSTSNRRLGSILIKLGYLTEDNLIDFLAKQQNHFTTTDYIRVDPDVIRIIPKYICNKYNCVPLCLDNNVLSVAMLDPTDTLAIISLEEYSGYIVKPMLASKSKIDTGLKLIKFTSRDIFNRDNFMFIASGISILLLMIFIGMAFFYGRIVHKEKYGTKYTTVNADVNQNKDIIIEKYYDGTFKLLGRGSHAYYSVSLIFNSKEELLKYIDIKKEDFSSDQLEYINYVCIKY